MARTKKTGATLTLASAVVVGTSPTVLFTGVDVNGLENLFFQVRNTGATAFNTFVLSSSADGANWITHDNATLASLAGTTDGKIAVANNGARYWRATASVGAGSTTVTVVFSGN